jgi:hypothetical protein
MAFSRKQTSLFQKMVSSRNNFILWLLLRLGGSVGGAAIHSETHFWLLTADAAVAVAFRTAFLILDREGDVFLVILLTDVLLLLLLMMMLERWHHHWRQTGDRRFCRRKNAGIDRMWLSLSSSSSCSGGGLSKTSKLLLLLLLVKLVMVVVGLWRTPVVRQTLTGRWGRAWGWRGQKKERSSPSSSYNVNVTLVYANDDFLI